MSDLQPNDRPPPGIDQISTHWAVIRDPVKFVMRYAPAIQGYLGVFLKNPHDVEDVCQTFLVRVLERGHVEEERLHGRFRDYLIVAVRNAALAFLRRKPNIVHDNTNLDEIPTFDSFVFPGDEEWISRWRRILLNSVWEALEHHQRETPGNLAHTVLRILADHPDEDFDALAVRVSALCGRPIQSPTLRKQVSRARRTFAGLLVTEIARTLNDPTPLQIEEELINLDLMKYVRRFLPEDWRTSCKLLDAD
ncbi:MAG: sigma-70 family RNA polymerase sigma factor [Gemmataceae bacterium]|nr:sigma-70 family RNA polymerase sigma factor [Gemmataceae bacterium]